ncbi:triple QxxK/R motif-containing protein-like [Uloborus diversus]|uniref:triple QxxK/R motif-containing protein-like n=1 Tax=Uloborus diversus TaxID=327109 RepID=UPI0024090BE3|nr:triple QxxK/R motif-containing protein-like [Uloborus diversus]
MGKVKDSGNHLPVDNYRKQIGKQDYKKSKAELKDIKAKAQAKQGLSNTYKDVTIMIGSMVAVIGVIYALLYLFLEKKDDSSKL